MPSYSASIVIRRSRDEVYRYMDDIHREREWQPNLRSARQSPPGEVRVGTRKSYESEFLGKRLRNTYVVKEMEPGRRVVQETTSDSSVNVTSTVTWEEVEGGTRVTLQVEARPSLLMRFLPRSLLEASTRSEIETSLQRLKECLEKS